MDPAVILKLITDLSIYLAFTGLFFPSAQAAFPVFLTALSGAACEYLYQKKPFVRALCFLPSAVIIALTLRSFSDAALLIPPFFYTAYAAYTGRVSVDRDEFFRYFRPAAALMIVCSLLGLFFDADGTTVRNNALPLTAAALFFGTLLLRTLRHTESTRRELRFVFFNLLAPLGALVLALVLYKAGFLSAVNTAVRFLYDKVLYPLLMGLAYAIYGVIWVIQMVFSFLFRGRIEERSEESTVILNDLQGELPPPDEGGGNPLVDQILLAMLILAGIAAAIFLFSRMLGARARRVGVDGGETRGRMEGNGRKHKGFSLFSPRSPNEQVRKLFMKFMLRARELGADITPVMTSERICLAAMTVFSNAEAIRSFRLLYLSARYSADTLSKADVRSAKQLQDDIFKSATKQDTQ